MWKTIDRPGYFGKKRNELQERFDKQYSPDNWRIAWEFGKIVLCQSGALQLYEDGYYEHFKAKPELLGWLVDNFSNVFDTAPSNVEAGFSYNVQETPSNHIHDVAIRRAVLRRGVWFLGKNLLEVRSTDTEGFKLSPCKIPFHLPEMIYRGQTKYGGEVRDFVANPPWWRVKGVKDSVEEFYQQNKILQVRE